jgi:class 3 adenylate cyclase
MDEEPSVQRRLAAILAADIAGDSRLMHEDEATTVRNLKAHQRAVLPMIGRHGGRIIDTAGDDILAEFPASSAPPSARWRSRRRWSSATRGCRSIAACGSGSASTSAT